MACNECHELDQIPECTDSIELGSIDADTEVYILCKEYFYRIYPQTGSIK
jgi:hypothetical protein